MPNGKHTHEWHYFEPEEHNIIGRMGMNHWITSAQRYCWCGVLEEKELKRV